MVYDSDGRESEVDMMVAAEFITPEHVARMRQHAGGLICLAISNDLAKKLELKYMHNILTNSNDLDSDSKNMIMGRAPYGDHPTFSISVNHKHTYTGITDSDRALTIKEMASLCNSDEPKKTVCFFVQDTRSCSIIACFRRSSFFQKGSYGDVNLPNKTGKITSSFCYL